MNLRTAAAALVLTAAASAPLSGVSHAQVDLDCRDFAFQEEAQAEFDRDPRDPHRLDEDPGPDDGIACEALPSRGATSTATATPTATATAPAQPTASATRGVRGGDGSTASGSSSTATVYGLGLTAAAAAVAAGFVVVKRRRRAKRPTID